MCRSHDEIVPRLYARNRGPLPHDPLITADPKADAVADRVVAVRQRAVFIEARASALVAGGRVDDRDVGRFLRLFTDLPLDEIQRLEALDGLVAQHDDELAVGHEIVEELVAPQLDLTA